VTGNETIYLYHTYVHIIYIYIYMYIYVYVCNRYSMAVACCMAYIALTLEAVPLRFSIHMYLYIRRKKSMVAFIFIQYLVCTKGDIAG